jgi:outer membrane cobalamin receptor
MRPFTRLAVSLFVLTAVPLRAGTLTGSVRTADGTPLPQVVLVADGPQRRTIVSGPEGRYRVELAAGEYALDADAPGLVVSGRRRVTVGDGETAFEVTLSPAPVRERVVVAATRSEAAASNLGIATDVLEGDAIAAREPSDLLHVLQQVPGVSVARTGGVGVQGSVFLRGGVSNFARVLVDGVPANEPGGAFDFGALAVLEVERIEVVRGAASSLYGTDALAGVLHLVTRRAGPGEARDLRLSGEGGSFDWQRYRAGTSGRAGRADWNAGLSRLTTDNEQPNSAFRQTAGAASAGFESGPTSLRIAARGEASEVGTPGQTAFARPDLDAYYERDVLVVSAEAARAGDRLLHQIRAGYARTDQPSFNPLDSGPYTPRDGDLMGPFELADFPSERGFANDTTRLSLGYEVEAQAGRRHLLTGGVDVERETGTLGAIGGADAIAPERTNVGAYLQDRIVLGSRVFATVGGRLERNASYGTRAVPRAAIAWRLRSGADATTLRASAGAGIKEPSFFESFGISFFARGNPDLDPERSRTWDAGLEQRLFGSRLRVQATAFHHEYLDQIAFQIVDFETFQGTYVNLGRSRARGVEVSVEAAPADGVSLGGQYTLNDGVVRASTSAFDPVFAEGEALLRRPRHQGALHAHARRGRFGGGATLTLVGARVDSDFLGLGLTRNDGYARLDARVQAGLGRGLEAFAVAENLLDREYMEVLGYPALGRSVRAGLRFRSAAR